MPTRFTEVHISSTVSSMSLRAKDHLEGTKGAVFPRYCAEQKVQTGSAAACGHRGVATRKTTGDLTTRRGAGDPERRAEWMTVSRYGHLQSALVVVDACYARSGNRLHSVQRGASSMASCLSNDAQTRLSVSEQAISVVRAEGSEMSRKPVQKIAELDSNSWRFPRLRLLIRPRGLWTSLRYPVRVDR